MDAFSEIQQIRSGPRVSFMEIFRMSRMQRREARWGLFFISPWLIGFLCFYAVPMIVSLGFSTLNFTLSAPEDATFVGLSNWRRMLFEDPNTWKSLGVTFKFAIISLPIGMVSAFLLAVMLNSKYLVAKSWFRTMFYAPSLIPGIASILIWSQVLNPSTGWLNRIIEITGIQAVGINGLRWMDDPNLIYIAYTFIGLWGVGNAMLINLAGLQNVPTELYEAAEIDGASWWSRLWRISIPMVSPVIFYNLILGVVGLLQYFITPFVLNQGNGYPEGSTLFYAIYFYKQAFNFQNMGYGAALAWLLFIVALILTMFLFWTGRYWIYYAGERR